MITQVDHLAQARDLMLSQFNDSPDLQSLLSSFLTPIQEMEGGLIAFLSSNGISNGTGVMLDTIGSWMGIEREDRTDIEYRQAILGKALIETMDGTCSKFYLGMKTLCNTEQVTFHENYPPTVYAQIGDGWNNATYNQVKAIKMAGVGFILLVDYNLDSMTLSEVLSQDNNLVTGADDTYQVIVDGIPYDLVTSQADNAVFDDSGDYPAELIDDVYTPMAEIVTQSYKIVEGFITDDEENFITDEAGNKYTYRDFS